MTTAAPAQPLIRCTSSCVTYRTRRHRVEALSGLDLSVHPGDFLAVTGPSGSGKSTLLGILSGRLGPTAGTVTSTLRRSEIGTVSQNPQLLAELTVTENVALAAHLAHVRRPEVAAQVAAALELLGVAPLSGESGDDLSGGELQRVALARAVVGERRLVIADEPTSSLDTPGMEAVARALTSLSAAGCAVVIATHDVRLAAHAHRVLRLVDGRCDEDTEHDPEFAERTTS